MNGYDSDEYDRHPSIYLLLNRKAELMAMQQQGTINQLQIRELTNITNALHSQKGGGHRKKRGTKKKKCIKKRRGTKKRRR
jgi:hypothetical protein